MQYMMLIYWDDSRDGERPSQVVEETYDAYRQVTAAMVANGQFKYGDALKPVVTSKTVSVRKGETIVTDGPFAETKEQLGGIYVVECDSEQDALALAAQIPHAQSGRVEVRPVLIY